MATTGNNNDDDFNKRQPYLPRSHAAYAALRAALHSTGSRTEPGNMPHRRTTEGQFRPSTRMAEMWPIRGQRTSAVQRGDDGETILPAGHEPDVLPPSVTSPPSTFKGVRCGVAMKNGRKPEMRFLLREVRKLA